MKMSWAASGTRGGLPLAEETRDTYINIQL